MGKWTVLFVVFCAEFGFANITMNLRSPLTVRQGGVNCTLNPGTNYSVLNKGASTYQVGMNDPLCGLDRVSLPGSNQLQLSDSSRSKNTGITYMRNFGQPSNIFNGPRSINPLCRVQDGAVLQAYGPVPNKLSWTKLNLSNRPECQNGYGFIPTDRLKEEPMENWTTVTEFLREGYDPYGYEPSGDSAVEATAPHCEDCERRTTAKGTEDISKIAKKINQNDPMMCAIEHAAENSEPNRTGWCYRYVKKALQKCGAVIHGRDGKGYLGGGSAMGAGKYLAKEGFVNLMDRQQFNSPYETPVGSILVYKGGDDGHIEINGGGKGYISDYVSKTPRTGDNLSANNRTLIGVYVKEGGFALWLVFPELLFAHLQYPIDFKYL